MTTTQIIETLAQIKNVAPNQINNLDQFDGTFEVGKCRYSYELTPSGKYIKTSSVKFLSTVEDYANCSL